MVRAAALSDHVVRPEDLPERIRNFHNLPDDASRAGGAQLGSAISQEEWPSLFEVEGRYVARVLAHTGGNKQAAARLLGVDRKTLQRMIDRHNAAVQATNDSRARTRRG